MNKKSVLFLSLALMIIAATVVFGKSDLLQGSFFTCNTPKSDLFLRDAKLYYSGISPEGKSLVYTGEVVSQNKSRNVFLASKQRIDLYAAPVYSYTAEPQYSAWTAMIQKWPCKTYTTTNVVIPVDDQFLNALKGSISLRFFIDGNKVVDEMDEENNIVDIGINAKIRNLQPSDKPLPFSGQQNMTWTGLTFADSAEYSFWVYTGEPTIYYTPEAQYVTVNEAFLKKVNANAGSITVKNASNPGVYNVYSLEPYAHSGVYSSVASFLTQKGAKASGLKKYTSFPGPLGTKYDQFAAPDHAGSSAVPMFYLVETKASNMTDYSNVSSLFPQK